MRNSIIKPCYHLDIKGEIPLKAQRLTRHGFFPPSLLSMQIEVPVLRRMV